MPPNQRDTIRPFYERGLVYPGSTEFTKGIAFATRLGLEMVVAVAVGAVLGYGIDRWLGSGPWIMIVGVFLGGIAGVLNVYRMATRGDS